MVLLRCFYFFFRLFHEETNAALILRFCWKKNTKVGVKVKAPTLVKNPGKNNLLLKAMLNTMLQNGQFKEAFVKFTQQTLLCGVDMMINRMCLELMIQNV